MSEQVPEYLRILQSRYPDYTSDAIIIANIGTKINDYAGNDRHADAVINQCRVAWETFNSIHCLVAYDYGLGAIGLCRSLFELVVGTIFLIDTPHKLNDFTNYGKLIACELSEALGAEQDYIQALMDKADYYNIKKRFGSGKWHGTSIKGLAEAGKMEGLYRSFYKETSSIAHGDSYMTLGYKGGAWELSKDVSDWSHYCEVSLEFSYLLMSTLYHKAVHSLKLPFVGDIQALMGHLIRKGVVQL